MYLEKQVLLQKKQKSQRIFSEKKSGYFQEVISLFENVTSLKIPNLQKIRS